MKTNTTTRNIESNTESTGFSIQASGKMFHMVISGLYSDKAQSITREIWSNAYDAHCMSGKADVPFDVTFPTVLDPTFTCRDYGDGLSPDFMLNLYTVLGHSEKENTNEAVGKWGVGRMSPLSYTDTFSIVSIHKGVKSFYSVTMGADGAPTITNMGNSDTTEPSGLSVSFPVKAQDLRNFQRAAQKVAYGFPVMPHVTNGDQMKPLEVVMSGKGYTLYRDPEGVMTGPMGRMGCVLYPLSRDYIPHILSYKNIIIDFPIGSLEVTASREQLSYGANDPTADFIRKYTAQTITSITNDLSDIVSKSKTLFEARLKAEEVSKQSGRIVNVDKLQYQGSDLFPKNMRGLYTVEGAPLHLGFEYGFVSRLGRKKASPTWEKTISLYSDKLLDKNKLRIVIQKKGKKSDPRAAQRIAAVVGSYETFLWVRINDSVTQSDIDDFVAQFGDACKVEYVKDYADIPPVRSVSKPVMVKSWNTNSRNYFDFEMSDEEFGKGGIYVETAGNNLVNHKGYEQSSYSPIYGLLSFFDKRFERLIRVPRTVVQKFKDADNWIEANDILDGVIKKHKKEILDDFYITKIKSLSIFHTCFYTLKDYPLPLDIQRYRSAYQAQQRTNKTELVTYAFNKEADKITETVKKITKGIIDKYPLLHYTNVYYGADAPLKKAMSDYLLLVDKEYKANTTTQTQAA